MNRSTWKVIHILICILAVFLVFLFAIGKNQGMVMITVLIYMVADLVCMHYLRCPNCGRWPGKHFLFDEYCPRCGEHLE